VTRVLTSLLLGDRTGRTDVRGRAMCLAESSPPDRAQATAVPEEKLPQVRRDISVGSAKRTAKLTISLLYYLVRGLSRFVLRLAGRAPGRKLIILYYHGIPDAYKSSFVRQLESIRRRARVLPASYRGGLPSGKPNVAITFDDAYASVAENALPELLGRGFHSTIFVPVGSLGNRPTWPIEDGSLDADETVMSVEQITSLPSSLVTLGSHTSTHPHLSRIEASIANEEIEGSRHKLQALTPEEVRLLAFPYGDHDASTIEKCKAAGYEHVFSVAPDPVDTTNSSFVRGRVKVDPFDWPLEFFLKYHGAYAWTSHVSLLKRKVRGWRKPLK
jgi:peptidoglycan/xylan/chitin deacetylase (PgdA/CDA1 family)